MSIIASSKSELRKFFLSKRNKVTNKYSNCVSMEIVNYAEEIFNSFHSSNIAGFYPFRNEINTLPLLNKLQSLGSLICLPVTPLDNTHLTFRKWNIDTKLTIGKYGILEPPEYCEETIPNLLLVPLLAYDVFGNRIGYGGGYYDKTLHYLYSKNNKIISIGVAFKFQECNCIPAEKHDIKLNAILNEDGLKFTKNK